MRLPVLQEGVPEMEVRNQGLAKLHQPLPADLVGTKVLDDGFEFTFIEWYDLCDILDTADPEWEHHVEIQVVPVSAAGGAQVVTVTATAHIIVDGVQRGGTAAGLVKAAGDFAKITKRVETDALFRAAVKFGVGRDWYRKQAKPGVVEPAVQVGEAATGAGPYTADIPGPRK